MFYIDEYGSKTIVDTPPKSVKKQEQVEQAQNDVLNMFWYSVGVTIAEQFGAVKKVLNTYGYNVSTEQEASTAISDILHTKRWPKFAEDMSPLLHKTIDAKFPAFAGM